MHILTSHFKKLMKVVLSSQTIKKLHLRLTTDSSAISYYNASKLSKHGRNNSRPKSADISYVYDPTLPQAHLEYITIYGWPTTRIYPTPVYSADFFRQIGASLTTLKLMESSPCGKYL